MDARSANFGAADAKAHFSELLARAEAGETITIRRHGKDVAKLIPATRQLSSEEKLKKVEAFIAWRKAHGPKLPDGVTVRDLINDGRRF